MKLLRKIFEVISAPRTGETAWGRFRAWFSQTTVAALGIALGKQNSVIKFLIVLIIALCLSLVIVGFRVWEQEWIKIRYQELVAKFSGIQAIIKDHPVECILCAIGIGIGGCLIGVKITTALRTNRLQKRDHQGESESVSQMQNGGAQENASTAETPIATSTSEQEAAPAPPISSEPSQEESILISLHAEVEGLL